MNSVKKGHLMELPNRVLIGHDIIGEFGSFLNDLGVDKPVLFVSGKNVQNVVKSSITESLEISQHKFDWKIIDNATISITDEVSELCKSNNYGIIVGIGGGKSVDVAKLSSYHSKIPFVSFPTSASHDGIASPFASLKGSDRPYSFVASPPLGIFADIKIISRAPDRLLSSGCGDLIAKITAVKDWELARDNSGERFGNYAANLSYMSSRILFDESLNFTTNKNDSVRTIVEALISTGVAAGIAGSSRPCSGSEHLISHALDIISPDNGLHGEKCGISSIVMSKLHGLDWQEIRAALQRVNCPTNVHDLGISDDEMIEAINLAPTIRPDRYTILNTTDLDRDNIHKLLSDTNCI
ncbi:MAG: NAD(P)-dependent glycerol-1-phosphate dehydrogenase [Nitrososphaerales archaeon]|jgi:glycerol-1-phosphate dehydrogenase [NAD(P)+]|nr:NAD(P)-dependent glycerol-1-phosphate dehydrogenase [Nitrososphaerales archaeon]